MDNNNCKHLVIEMKAASFDKQQNWQVKNFRRSHVFTVETYTNNGVVQPMERSVVRVVN